MAERDELAIPVAETVVAMYLVPATFPHERLAAMLRSAVARRVPEPVRSLVLQLLRADVVSVGVQPADALRTLTGLTRGYGVTNEQAAPVIEAEFFAGIGVELRPQPGPVHEWVSRAAAASLAADQGVPVVDACTRTVVDPRDLLDSLPGSAELADSPGSFRLSQWLDALGPDDGRVRTRGLIRFGLPELVISEVPEEHAEQWELGLYGLAHRLYRVLRDELRQERQPAFLAVPAELELRPVEIGAAVGMALADTDGLPVRLSLDVTVGELYESRIAVDAPPSWPGTAAQHRAALLAVLREAAVASLAKAGGQPGADPD